MSKQPKVTIIILNWNGKEDTCQCIQSVQNVEYANYEIVVVDNGSQDGSADVFREKFSGITVIETGKNLGYAEGNNQGITYALNNGAEYTFILNNDATVDPYILNNLVEVAESDSTVGILGAKIYYASEPNKIWFAGGIWKQDIALTAHEGLDQFDDGSSWEAIKEIDYACGCALFVKADVFRTIGLLEQKFFLMWEETDFCFRATRHGYRCLFVPKAYVWHKVSASFPGGGEGYLQQYFKTRNRLLWLERNIPFSDRLKIFSINILPDIKFHLKGYLNPMANLKRREQSRVNLAAYGDYILRRFGDCPSWIRSL